MRLGEKWSSTVFLRGWTVSVLLPLFLVCTSALGQSEENFNTDPIIATGSSLDQDEQYASYLFPNDGYIYVSFDSSIDGEFRDWWLEVLAFSDSIIEPEFVLISADSNLSQMVIYNIDNYNTTAGTPGLYSSPLTSYWSDGTITRESLATLEIAQSAYSHAARFAKSEEAGWKHVAFHELGHALGLEHSHNGEDGDIDTTLTTNDTVMSYLTERDEDGRPSFTELDIQALVQIYGEESVHLPKPAFGELISEFENIDLNQTWKPPILKMSLNNGQNLMEPESTNTSNIYYLNLERSDGYIGEEATVFLDWNFSENLYWDYSESDEDVESWLDLRFKSAGYPSSVVFDPGVSAVQLKIEVFKSDYSEDEDEWIEVTARDQFTSPGYFEEIPATIRLKVVEYELVNSPPTGSISIDGNLSVGSTVYAINNLQDSDGLGTLSYKWYANDEEIAGQVSSSITLSSDLEGKALNVVATYIDGEGYLESISSIKTAQISPANSSGNGWMWFDYYPWVYSAKESGWLYFLPWNSRIMVYSAKDNQWKELAVQPTE